LANEIAAIFPKSDYKLKRSDYLLISSKVEMNNDPAMQYKAKANYQFLGWSEELFREFNFSREGREFHVGTLAVDHSECKVAHCIPRERPYHWI
jgi:hypothetical protein